MVADLLTTGDRSYLPYLRDAVAGIAVAEANELP